MRAPALRQHGGPCRRALAGARAALTTLHKCVAPTSKRGDLVPPPVPPLCPVPPPARCLPTPACMCVQAPTSRDERWRLRTAAAMAAAAPALCILHRCAAGAVLVWVVPQQCSVCACCTLLAGLHPLTAVGRRAVSVRLQASQPARPAGLEPSSRRMSRHTGALPGAVRGRGHASASRLRAGQAGSRQRTMSAPHGPRPQQAAASKAPQQLDSAAAAPAAHRPRRSSPERRARAPHGAPCGGS